MANQGKRRWKLRARRGGRKNHSINRERSHVERKRHRRAKHRLIVNKKRKDRDSAFFAMFWSGPVKTFKEVRAMMRPGWIKRRGRKSECC